MQRIFLQASEPKFEARVIAMVVGLLEQILKCFEGGPLSPSVEET